MGHNVGPRLEKFGSNKHYGLFGQFVSYKENEVLWIRPLGPYSQDFIFIVTFE
jgi:hypothetical protein